LVHGLEKLYNNWATTYSDKSPAANPSPQKHEQILYIEIRLIYGYSHLVNNQIFVVNINK